MASRKLWFSAFALLLILASGWILPEAAVGDVVAGLVSVTAVYVGGNTAVKWVLGRAPGLAQNPNPSAPQKPVTKSAGA